MFNHDRPRSQQCSLPQSMLVQLFSFRHWWPGALAVAGDAKLQIIVGKPGCWTTRSNTGPPWGRLVHSKMVAVLLRMLSPSVLSERQIGANPIIFFPISPLGTNRPCALLCTLHEHPFAIICTATNSTSLSGPVSDRVGFARLDT
jgi:hypothetical protein